LAGGDDYELIFTVSNNNLLALEAAIANEVRCTPIGRMVASQNSNHVVTCYRGGEPISIERQSYNHFA
jgi:thiamine-monophosphate kinase